MNRNRWIASCALTVLLTLFVLMAAPTISAQQGGTTRYSYDDNGRLRSVTLPNGETAVYQYDAAGNILSITRQLAALPTITGFAPSIGTSGTAVTINGTNFDPTAANNLVKFHNTAAVVSTSVSTSLTTSVPTGATSGRISLATPFGSVVSTADFFVPPSPFTAGDVESTDRMVIGQSKQVTINTVNKVALVVFDGVAGQRLALKNNNGTISSSNIIVYKPDGTTLVSASNLSPTSGFIAIPALPATGTYLILIDPVGSNTGTLNFTLNEVIDFTGSIAIDGPPVTVPITVGGQQAQLTFEGTAGQRVSLLVSNAGFSHNLYIYNPDGTTLFQRLLISSGTRFYEPVILPVVGTYTIQIIPNNNATGNITLRLFNVVDVTGAITPGSSSVTATLTAPGQKAAFTFNGTAGQQVSLLVNDVINLGFNGSITVFKPDGTNLGVSAKTSVGTFLDTKNLPVDGIYTLVIDPDSADTGTIRFTLFDCTAIVGTIEPNGQPVTANITVPGQTVRLTFNGTAGQKVSLQLNQSAMPLGSVSLFNTDGIRLGLVSFNGGSHLEPITLLNTGTYTVVIDPSLAAIGSATITLYDVPPDVTGTLIIGEAPVTVNLNAVGQNALFTFNGLAGQQVTVRVTGNTLNCPTVKLLKADGTLLTSVSPFASCNSSFNLTTQILPAAGDYRIRIEKQTLNTGSIEINVTNP